jgi:hypothetical protein
VNAPEDNKKDADILPFKRKLKKAPMSQSFQEWEDYQHSYPDKIRKALDKHGHLKGKKSDE